MWGGRRVVVVVVVEGVLLLLIAVVRGPGRSVDDGEMYGVKAVVVVLGFLEEVARRVRTVAASNSP
jgi:hypothetical protein